MTFEELDAEFEALERAAEELKVQFNDLASRSAAPAEFETHRVRLSAHLEAFRLHIDHIWAACRSW
jgi:hypothetical protein